VVLDIGSGKSVLWSFLNGRYSVWINLDRFIDSPRPEWLPDRVWQLEGDAHALPIRSGSLDTVCLVSVLEHFDSASLAMREIRRVLAPAGRIILTVPRDPRRFFLHRPDLVGALATAKINITAFDAVSVHGRYGAIFWVAAKDMKKATKVIAAMNAETDAMAQRALEAYPVKAAR
jgi:SAM-dependent methyltransferase